MSWAVLEVSVSRQFLLSTADEPWGKVVLAVDVGQVAKTPRKQIGQLLGIDSHQAQHWAVGRWCRIETCGLKLVEQEQVDRVAEPRWRVAARRVPAVRDVSDGGMTRGHRAAGRQQYWPAPPGRAERGTGAWFVSGKNATRYMQLSYQLGKAKSSVDEPGTKTIPPSP